MACPHRKKTTKHKLLLNLCTYDCVKYQKKFNNNPDNNHNAKYCSRNDINNSRNCPVFNARG